MTLCKRTGRVPFALRLAGDAACALRAFHFCAQICAFLRRNDTSTSIYSRSTVGVRSSMLASSGERRDAPALPPSRSTTQRRREKAPRNHSRRWPPLRPRQTLITRCQAMPLDAALCLVQCTISYTHTCMHVSLLCTSVHLYMNVCKYQRRARSLRLEGSRDILQTLHTKKK